MKKNKKVEDQLLSMMRENPSKLLMYFLSILGHEMNDANAGELQLSQEMDINGKRYKISCKAKLKSVKVTV